MGNKKGLIWYCILFNNKEKSEICKVLKCDTISEMSYYLDIPAQTIRNFYHNNNEEFRNANQNCVAAGDFLYGSDNNARHADSLLLHS